MNLSFALVVALFLLAPGFAAYAGLFTGSRSKSFQPASAAPGSLFALGFISVAAIFAHALAALLFWLNEVAFERAGGLAIGIEPNLYVALVALPGGDTALLSGQIVAILFGLVALCLAAFVAAVRAVRLDAVRARLTVQLYGWLSELVEASRAPDRYVSAFVLTDIEHDGQVLGYEGFLENLSVDSGKQIVSLLLSDSRRFRIRMSDAGVAREALPHEDTIALIYLEREHVRNVAFTVYAAGVA